MAEPLRLDGVTRRHGSLVALDGVDLAARPGERLALLGHNGAGKTTLIKLALGLLAPSSGKVRVCGHAPDSRAARATTAYLPEAVAFHPALTGREQLRLFVRLAGAPTASVGPLLERVGLAEAADRRIRTWSKGMRQRLGIAQMLIGQPRLALLDEPTSGLDPILRHELYGVIDAVAGAGAAVLIASHALSELETRADRIAILSRGRVVADDTVAGLRAAAALPVRVRVVARDADASELADRLGGERVNGASVVLSCRSDEKMACLGRVAELGALVSDIDVTSPGLEDLYRHFSEEGRA